MQRMNTASLGVWYARTNNCIVGTQDVFPMISRCCNYTQDATFVYFQVLQIFAAPEKFAAPENKKNHVLRIIQTFHWWSRAGNRNLCREQFCFKKRKTPTHTHTHTRMSDSGQHTSVPNTKYKFLLAYFQVEAISNIQNMKYSVSDT